MEKQSGEQNKVCLIKYNEIFLKNTFAKNRFISILVNNIKNKTGKKVEVKRNKLIVRECNGLEKIFGIYKYIEAIESPRDIEKIWQTLKKYIKKGRFAVRVKRSDKRYPLTSKDVEIELGRRIVELGNKVDLTNPEHVYRIEIDEEKAYIYLREYKGLGGLPIGSEGRAVMLFSGGFDSVMASYLAAKRGIKLSYLYIDIASKEYRKKVYEIYKKIAEYTGGDFHYIDFAETITQINKKIKEGLKQVVLKRKMYEGAVAYAKKIKADAIITGENIGQVSTQTLNNLKIISENINFLVIRPVATYDKQEIIDFNRKIGIYEINSSLKEVCSISKKANPEVKQSIIELADSINQQWIFKKIEEEKEKRIRLHVDEAKEENLSKDKKYELYCNTGVRAKIRAKELREKGYDVI